MNKKIKSLIKKFRIKIILDPEYRNEQGTYTHGREIIIGNKPNNYTLLHEIGHVIYGYGCCREHDEYIAHGIAIGLAKALDIPLGPHYKRIIDCYAGRSSHESCGAIEQRRKKECKKSRKRLRLNLWPFREKE